MISDFGYHLLRKNHAIGFPTRCIYLDTETFFTRKGDIETHAMRLAWTCSARYDRVAQEISVNWREWLNQESMWKYIEAKAVDKSRLYIFGHNIFFDLQVSGFFDYFDRWGWVLDFIYEKSLTYCLVVKKDSRFITCLSSTNFFHASLEELGKLLGYSKGEVDFKTASFTKLSAYCKRDVEILKKIMEQYFQFILKHDLGSFSMTQASQAFRAFRHRFMTTKIYIHDSPEVKKLERDAYMGGRVEAFSWGEQQGGPFVTLDVNSMYSFIMKLFPVPHRLIEYIEHPDISLVDRLSGRFGMVAEVEVETDDNAYAVKRDHKLIFPTGHFRCFVCSQGMRYAFERKHLVKVCKVAIYEQTHLFRDYVEYFYPLKAHYKEENNAIWGEMVKVFLNALYGKFGEKKYISEEREVPGLKSYTKSEVFDLDRGVWVHEYRLLNKILSVRTEEDAPTSFAAIAAHITEAARLHLWKIIEAVGRNNVLYCDTDSIKIRKKDIFKVSSLFDETELGKLKLEGTSNKLTIQGAKSYITESKRVLKGVPHKAVQTGPYCFRYPSFLRQNSHLREGLRTGYIVRWVDKEVTPNYDKGVLNPNGTISPFHFVSPDQLS